MAAIRRRYQAGQGEVASDPTAMPRFDRRLLHPPSSPLARLGAAAALLAVATAALMLHVGPFPAVIAPAGVRATRSATVSEAPAGPAAPSSAGSGATQSVAVTASGGTPSGQTPVAPAPAAAVPTAAGAAHLATPDPVRGIYLTGWSAGNPAVVKRLLAYSAANRINTWVIDIKDSQLCCAFPGTPAAALPGYDAHRIAHPRQLIARLHRRHIYVIGRIVSFADSFAALHHPSWAVHVGGRLYHDGVGFWLDPRLPAAQRYNIAIGVAAARLGFDEIQFDYVRFPGAQLTGYNVGNTWQQRSGPIVNFLSAARTAIHAVGVPVSADIFGIDLVNHNDSDIGQYFPADLRAVDYTSPMDYPSLYAPHTFAAADPAAHPYQTSCRTLEDGLARIPRDLWGRVRPWVQDFNLRGAVYGASQVNRQIEAIYDAGLRSFLLWNPQNVYSTGVIGAPAGPYGSCRPPRPAGAPGPASAGSST